MSWSLDLLVMPCMYRVKILDRRVSNRANICSSDAGEPQSQYSIDRGIDIVGFYLKHEQCIMDTTSDLQFKLLIQMALQWIKQTSIWTVKRRLTLQLYNHLTLHFLFQGPTMFETRTLSKLSSRSPLKDCFLYSENIPLEGKWYLLYI